VRINNRKLVDALLGGCGLTDRETQKHVLRVVDKLLKVGLENVRKELGPGRVDESGDPIKGVGLAAAVIDKTLLFISTKRDQRESTLEALASLLPRSETTATALGEGAELNAALASLGVSQAEALLDASLMRGLDYYTGPVFEAVLPSAPQFGSVMGGGRYDQLVARFLDRNVPSTGASIGLDRLMDALRHLGKVQLAPTTTKVLVLAMRGVAASELLRIAAELRAQGIPSEVFFGDPKAGIRDQLSVANARLIPVAVIMGEDELKSGKVSVKDLKVGAEARASIQDREQYRKSGKSGQTTVARADLVRTVKQLL
jgi:histidyl-tRNA synthetase